MRHRSPKNRRCALPHRSPLASLSSRSNHSSRTQTSPDHPFDRRHTHIHHVYTSRSDSSGSESGVRVTRTSHVHRHRHSHSTDTHQHKHKRSGRAHRESESDEDAAGGVSMDSVLADGHTHTTAASRVQRSIDHTGSHLTAPSRSRARSCSAHSHARKVSDVWQKARHTLSSNRSSSEDDSGTHAGRTMADHICSSAVGTMSTSPHDQQQQQSSARRCYQLDCLLHELLHHVELTDEDEQCVRSVLSDLQDVLKPLGLNIALYGSLCTGIRTPNSDIDCVMVPVGDIHGIRVCQPLRDNSSPSHKRAQASGLTPSSPSPLLSAWSIESSRKETRAGGAGDSSSRKENDGASRSDRNRRLGSHHVRQVMAALHNALGTASEHKSCYISALRVVSDVMRGSRMCSRVFCITRARIPIIKCVHGKSRMPVDLSFSADGVTTSRFLCLELAQSGNEAVRGLTILVKMLLSQAGLHDASVGGLGSFPVSLMMLWYVKYVACDFDRDLRSSLSTMLIGFLKYYSCDFDYNRQGIDYVAGKTFHKAPAPELFLVNPMKPCTNCAKAATLFATKVIPFFYTVMRTLSSLISEKKHESKKETTSCSSSNSSAKNTDDSVMCTKLAQLFDQAVPACRNWSRVRYVTQERARRAQNKWCESTNMYKGGTWGARK